MRDIEKAVLFCKSSKMCKKLDMIEYQNYSVFYSDYILVTNKEALGPQRLAEWFPKKHRTMEAGTMVPEEA